MDPITSVLVLVGVLNLALAGVVLHAAPTRETNRVFSAAALSVAVWTLTNAGFRSTQDVGTAVLLSKLSYGAAVTLGSAFLHFSWTYPRPLKSGHSAPMVAEKWVAWLAAILVVGLAFVPGVMVQSVDLADRRIVTAPGVYLVAVHMLVTSGLAFGGFYRHQVLLRGRLRAQARFVLYGSFLTAVCGLVCNLALPLSGNYDFVWAGPASSVFFVGFSGVSIVAHHLFDIRVLIRRTVVYSTLSTLLLAVFIILEKVTEWVVPKLLGEGHGFTNQVVPALVVGVAFDPLRKSAKKLVRKWLFRNESERADR